jgi:hypothetical protein
MSKTKETHEVADTRSDNLRDSPMMAHLLDALEAGQDVGHYGRLTFVMVGGTSSATRRSSACWRGSRARTRRRPGRCCCR